MVDISDLKSSKLLDNEAFVDKLIKAGTIPYDKREEAIIKFNKEFPMLEKQYHTEMLNLLKAKIDEEEKKQNESS